MKIAVIDGKGGGIGRSIVECLKPLKTNDMEIIVLGTNSHATANMLRAGADNGATGENAIVYMSTKVDLIIGPIAIITANAMMGEISPKIAQAIGSTYAKKWLLPTSQCQIDVIGAENLAVKSVIQLLKARFEEHYC